MEIVISFITENAANILNVVVTIIIASITAIYTISTNTKKYELTERYRCELLSWYRDAVETMMEIINYCESGEFYLESFSQERIKSLSKLSALVEIGRFYFPNIIKNDGFGKHKPAAYQGYRHIELEFLLNFYFIASNEPNKRQINSLRQLERQFTSFIFNMIEPRKYNKKYSKYLSITIPQGQSIEDYLEENPNNIEMFIWNFSYIISKRKSKMP